MPTPRIPVPSYVLITPDLALDWLTGNTENRRLRQPHIDKIARDIQAGHWKFTGDPIRFDDRGVLIDGQHRLHAIVKANVAQALPSLLIRDLPTSVRDVIDTGLSRSAADVLTFQGKRHASKLAAAAKIGLAKEGGLLQTAGDARGLPRYSNTEVQEYLDRHPEYENLVARANTSGRLIGMRSVAGWLYSLAEFDYVDPDAALEFETSLVETRTDGLGDPRAALLRWLQDDRRGNLNTRVALPRMLYATNRAWNGWRQREHLQRIVIFEQSLIPDAV